MNSRIDATLFNRLVTDNSYEKSYPEIQNLNVFSCSSLAYSVQKQVEWKLNPMSHSRMNATMFSGKAIHEFFQKRFLRFDDSWRTEYSVRMNFHFNWKTRRLLSGYRIIGHVDLINLNSHQIIEIKTSQNPNAKISDYMRRQIGFYWKCLKDETGEEFEAYIVRISDTIQVEQVKKLEMYYQQLARRGYLCARILDGQI